MKELKSIIIPTLGRINRQITYERMPQKYKDIVTFVVQPQETKDFTEKGIESPPISVHCTTTLVNPNLVNCSYFSNVLLSTLFSP
jgi:hypothetical protein